MCSRKITLVLNEPSNDLSVRLTCLKVCERSDVSYSTS